MDLETQLELARGSVTNLITKELKDSNSVKVQMTAWILFKVEDEVGMGTSSELIQSIRNSIVE